MNWWGKL